MTRVLQILDGPVDRDTRRRLRDRAKVLLRGIEFLDQRPNEHLASIRSRGWTSVRIEVVCELAAFYQIVVGPLVSAGRRRGPSGLVRRTAIRYGSDMLFDQEYARDVRAMEVDFHRLVERTGAQRWWLVANGAGDLVYRMAQHTEGDVGGR